MESSKIEDFKTLASRTSSEIMSAVTSLQQGKEPDGSVSSVHIEAALLSLKQTAHRLNVDAGAIAAPQAPEEPAKQADGGLPEFNVGVFGGEPAPSEEPVAKPAEAPVKEQ